MYTTLTVAYAASAELSCCTYIWHIWLGIATLICYFNFTTAPACMLLSIKIVPILKKVMAQTQSIWRRMTTFFPLYFSSRLTSWQPCFLFCFSFLLYFFLFPLLSFISWRHLTVWKYTTIPLIHLYYAILPPSVLQQPYL